MSDRLYLDSSAAAKLVLPEPESPALRETVRDRSWTVSELTVTETVRTARRRGVDGAGLVAELRRDEVVPVGPEVLGVAAALDPPSLRTLDAIHLATVLLAGHNIGALVTYDPALADAATAYGVRVLGPA